MSDNKKSQCFAKMSNDLAFRNYVNNKAANNKFKRENLDCLKEGSEHRYRFFLQKNAVQIMDNDFNSLKKSGCVKRSKSNIVPSNSEITEIKCRC